MNNERKVKCKYAEILLVEDNENDIDLMHRIFRKLNLTDKVFVVKDGAEALDFIFAKGPYDGRNDKKFLKLILLDLKLPKVDGFEVLRRVKSDERMKFTPVVILTSSAEETDIRNCYLLSANSYIVKPLEYQEYNNIITDAINYWVLSNKMPYSSFHAP